MILKAVRWYFSYRSSAANVRNLLAERGLDVSRQAVADWALKFGVLLAEVGRRHTKPLGRRWFVNETNMRVGKRWAHLVGSAAFVTLMLLAVRPPLRHLADLYRARGTFTQGLLATIFLLVFASAWVTE